MITPELVWPLERLGEAFEVLARRAGLAPRPVEPPAAPDGLVEAGAAELSAWVMAVAESLAISARPRALGAGELRTAGPAIVQLQGPPGFVALLGARGSQLTIIGPDHATVTLASEALAPAAPLRSWLLRGGPRASLWRQASDLRLPRWFTVLVAAQAAQHGLTLLSFWLIGHAALGGQVDRGWLLGWTLLLLSLVPLRVLSRRVEGTLILGFGGLLKERLLVAATSLAPDARRHHGAGQLLGRVNESDTMESYLLGGGLQSVVGVVELVFAVGVLATGPGGWLHAGMLGLWLGLALLVARRYYHDRCHWTEERVEMTHGLVENIVGHRTRLVQQLPRRWHEDDDQRLAHLFQTSQAMERAGDTLMTLLPRGWLPFGVLGLAPVLVAGHESPASLAIGLGGVLLAHRGARRFALGLWYLAGAAAAWQQVAAVLRLVEAPEPGGLPALAVPSHSPSPARDRAERPVLAARGLRFGYRDRGRPVLRDVSLTIAPGDRIVLRGASGTGKSTLAGLMTGLLCPHSGAVLATGLDRRSLGPRGWSRRIAVAPQFHDNHIFAGSLAFNLLMNRQWPPSPGDLAEAESICRELGLGALLERMPLGLEQTIGAAGWQLSHGERCRVYLARALLQRAELVVLDEILAALDPETALVALTCIRRRAPAVVLIEQA